ncbi:MAG: hypothetical protein JEY96_06840 [Bacteroidales bacterium]|jgi:hypothetical protein|nr:hypothetical protein [Bacteroidales bacterium]
MKNLLMIVFVCLTSIVYSQESDSLKNKKYIQKINIIYPGVSGEILLSKQKCYSLNYTVGLAYKFMRKEADYYFTGGNNSIQFLGFISVEFRDYISYKNRKERGYRTDRFSGGYGSFKFEFGRVLDYKQTYIELGPMIGFQRAIGKVWYWDVNAGVGPLYYDDVFTFSLFGGLRFGFSF